MTSHPFRSGRVTGIFLALLLSVFLLAPTSTVSAGEDDFEFGQNLVNQGRRTADPYWFDLARQVFQRMLDDPKSSGERKDLAKYGLATLAQGEAEAAQNKSEIAYAKVKTLYETAITDIENFVKRNPKHEKANEAGNLVGVLRLAFVQWARDSLLTDADLMSERQTDSATVQADAQRFVDDAIRYFEQRRQGWDTNTNNDNALAQYYWVVCQYYRALVQDRCSSGAISLLKSAANELEDFIGFFDGNTVALYAQDFYGLTNQELGSCADTDEEREKYYGEAMMWLSTCIEAPALGPDTLRIIARGYYHIGQLGLQAGRVGDSNFYRISVGYLRKMLSRTPLAAKYDDGIRAMFEWAKLEHKLERTEEAIRITSEAATRAKRLSKGYLEFEANRLLKTFVSSGTATGGDPAVLLRVADGEYAAERWTDAIAAYEGVIRSLGDSREDFMTYGVPAWKKISLAYGKLGDLLGEALALEPIHEAWVDGLIEKTRQAEDEFGLLRLKTADRYSKLYEATKSATFRNKQKEIQAGFARSYPNNEVGQATVWITAMDAWKAALEAKRKGDSNWKTLMQRADTLMTERTKDDGKKWQHFAFVMRARIADALEKWQDVISRADKAVDFWNSAKVKAALKDDEKMQATADQSMGKTLYWKAKSQNKLGDHAGVLKTLENYRARYADLDEIYVSGALGFEVLAHVANKDIDKADGALRILIRKYPTNPNLPSITFQLAKFYQDQWQETAKAYSALITERQGDPSNPEAPGLSKRITELEKRAVNIRTGLGSLRGRKNTLERLIKSYEDVDGDQLQTNVTPEQYEAGKKELAETNQTIAQRTTDLRKVEAELQTAEARKVTINEEIDALKPKMYDPLKKAADYYKDWDDVVIANKGKRTATNVKLFADNYERLTKLRPEVEENWQIAQKLYEDYLELSRKDTEERSEVLSSLGRVYSYRAKVEDDKTKKAALVSKAVELLQGAFAKLPGNNELVLGMLDGRYAVLPWTPPNAGRQYYFPVPKSANSVAELRKAVKQLGSSGGTPVPAFESDDAKRRYGDALRAFQRYIQGLPDGQLRRTARSLPNAVLDANFLKEVANTRRGFRIALARGYSESNRPEDAVRAMKLAGTLLDGRLRVPEESRWYWEAQVILIRAELNHSQGLLAGGKDASAQAKELLDAASRRITNLHGADPRFGEDEVEGNEAAMKELIEQLNVLRQSARMGIFRLAAN